MGNTGQTVVIKEAPAAEGTRLQTTLGKRKIKKKLGDYRIRQLSERDYKVLEYLAWGPGNVASLSNKFFPSPEGEIKTGNGKKSHGISRYTLKRLRQLERAGYIQMKKGNNLRKDLGSDSHIVVLQPAGAIEVVLRFNYDLDNIKQSFPKPLETLHDIMVASTIRKIVDE